MIDLDKLSVEELRAVARGETPQSLAQPQQDAGGLDLDSMDVDQLRAIARGEMPSDKAPLGSVLARGADITQSNLYRAMQGYGKARGLEGVQYLGQTGAERNAEEAARSLNPERLLTWDEAQGLSGVGRFALEQGISSAAGMAAPLAGGIVGTAVGGPLGGIAGGTLGAYPELYGSNLQTQIDENGQITDNSKAATAAVGQAALEGLFSAFPLGKVAGRFVGPGLVASGTQLGRILDDNLLPRVVKNAVVTGLGEGSTEAAQQVLQRWQAGQELLDDEAYREYKESFIAGALVGGSIAGGVSVFTKPNADPNSPDTLRANAAAARLSQDGEVLELINTLRSSDNPDDRQKAITLENNLQQQLQITQEKLLQLEYKPSQTEIPGAAAPEPQTDYGMRGARTAVGPTNAMQTLEDTPAALTGDAARAFALQNADRLPFVQNILQADAAPEAKQAALDNYLGSSRYVQDLQQITQPAPSQTLAVPGNRLGRTALPGDPEAVAAQLQQEEDARAAEAAKRQAPTDAMMDALRAFRAMGATPQQTETQATTEAAAGQRGFELEKFKPFQRKAAARSYIENLQDGEQPYVPYLQEVLGTPNTKDVTDFLKRNIIKEGKSGTVTGLLDFKDDQFVRRRAPSAPGPEGKGVRVVPTPEAGPTRLVAPPMDMTPLPGAVPLVEPGQTAPPTVRAARKPRAAKPAAVEPVEEVAPTQPLAVKAVGKTTRSPTEGTLHGVELNDGSTVYLIRDTYQFGTPVWHVEDPLSSGKERPSEYLGPIGYTKAEALESVAARVEYLRSQPDRKQTKGKGKRLKPEAMEVREEEIAPAPELGIRDDGRPAPTTEAAPAAEQPRAEAGPKLTPEQIADKQATARKRLNEILAEIKKRGPAGRIFVRKFEEVLKDRRFTTAEVYHAYLVTDTATSILRGTKAAPDVIFSKVTGLEKETGNTTPGSYAAPNTVGLRGVMEFALRDDVQKYLRQAAAHEPFHLLQDLITDSDPEMSRILFGKQVGLGKNKRGIYEGGAFFDGMTLADVDPTVRNFLETHAPDLKSPSYWEELTDREKRTGTAMSSQREMMAHIFGSLADARLRGISLGNVLPVYKRMTNFLVEFKKRLASKLRGDGYRSIRDILDTYAEGKRQQGYGQEINFAGRPKGTDVRKTPPAKLTPAEAMMVSERATTFDPDMKAKAEQMEKDGTDPDIIWIETGLARAPYDRKWRAEVPDTYSMFKGPGIGALNTKGSESLKRVLDHDELYNAYPFLENVKIEVDPSYNSGDGMYLNGIITVSAIDVRAADKKLSSSKAQLLRSVILHEIQHAVQDHEGVFGGANPKRSIDMIAMEASRIASDRLYDGISEDSGKFTSDYIAKVGKDVIERRAQQVIFTITGDGRGELYIPHARAGTLNNPPVPIDVNGDKISNPKLDAALKADDIVGPLFKSYAAVDASAKTIKTVYEEAVKSGEKAMRSIRNALLGSGETNYRIYRGAPGEQESRMTEARLRMAAEELAKKRPDYTKFDFGGGRLIDILGGKVAAIISPNHPNDPLRQHFKRIADLRAKYLESKPAPASDFDLMELPSELESRPESNLARVLREIEEGSSSRIAPEPMLVGEGATSFPGKLRKKAEELEDLGHSPTDIYLKTGLARGDIDGQWRHEVPDDDSKVVPEVLGRIARGVTGSYVITADSDEDGNPIIPFGYEPYNGGKTISGDEIADLYIKYVNEKAAKDPGYYTEGELDAIEGDPFEYLDLPDFIQNVLPSGSVYFMEPFKYGRSMRIKAWTPRSVLDRSVKLTDLLDHPEIYKSYPLLAEIKVVRDTDPNRGGYFDRQKKEIGVSGSRMDRALRDIFMYGDDGVLEEVRSTLIHEIQHYVQNYEGFVGGLGSKDNLEWAKRNVMDQAMKALDPIIFDVRAAGRRLLEKKPDIAGKISSAIGNSYSKNIISNAIHFGNLNFKYFDSIDDFNRFLKAMRSSEETSIVADLAELSEDLRSIIDTITKKIDEAGNLSIPLGDNARYFGDPGEKEARNVQYRLKLTPEERRQKIFGVGDTHPNQVQYDLAAGYVRNILNDRSTNGVIGELKRNAEQLVSNMRQLDSETGRIAPEAMEVGPVKETASTRLSKRLDEIGFIPKAVITDVLGSDRPKYLDAVIKFMAKQRKKTISGKLTPRDILKAWFITVASQRAGAINPDLVFQKSGYRFPDEFLEENGTIRPEEAAAAWLETPAGQRALDSTVAGNPDMDAWENGFDMRRAWGSDVFKNSNFVASFPKLQAITDEINAAKGNVGQITNAVQKLNGIATVKKEFLKYMLGFGDTPTIDAVEVNFWLTGKADISKLKDERAEFVRDINKSGSKDFMLNLIDRIQGQMKQMRSEIPALSNIPEDFYYHVLHHWIWDKAKGSATTHTGSMRVMIEAMETGEGGNPLSRAFAESMKTEPTTAQIKEANIVANSIKAAVMPSQVRGLKTFGERASALSELISDKFHPFGGIKDKDFLRRLRYITIGNINRVTQEAKSLWQTMSTADQNQKRAVYKYLTTKNAPEPNVPPALRAAAVKAKERIGDISNELLKRKLISQKEYDKWKDGYLPRLYMEYLEAPGSGGLIRGGLTPSSMGYLRERLNLPQDLRIAKGEVKDPAFLSFAALLVPQRDMFLLDYMGEIAKHSDKGWVLPTSMVKWRGSKVSPLWAANQADIVRRQAAIEPDTQRKATMERVAGELQALVDGYQNPDIPKGYVKMPNSPVYGPLAGVIIRKEIKDDIVGLGGPIADLNTFDKMFSPRGLIGRGTAIWKYTKTVLSPSAQFRQLYSNTVMLHLSGVNLHMVPQRIVQAIQSYRAKDEYFKIGEKYGVGATGMVSQELYSALDELEATLKIDAKVGVINIPALNTAFNKAMNIIKATGRGAEFAYDLGDSIFKLAKIIDEMEKSKGKDMSLSDREWMAASEAHKWFLDYSEVPNAVKAARSSVLGAPFLTYYYKVAPLMVEVLLKNPLKLLPYVALHYGAYALASAAFGEDDDDIEKLRKVSQEFLKDNPSALPLPYLDEDGRPQIMDIGYIFPWQMFTNIIGALIKAPTDKGSLMDVVSATGFLGNPFINLTSAMTTNTDPFTNKPIVNEFDPVSKQYSDRLSYVWNLAMPPFLSVKENALSPHFQLLGLAFGGERELDRKGEPKLAVSQLVARMFGVNIYPVDPQYQRAQRLSSMMYDLKQTKMRFAYRMKDPNLTPERRRELAQQGREEMRRRSEAIEKFARETKIPEGLRARSQ